MVSESLLFRVGLLCLSLLSFSNSFSLDRRNLPDISLSVDRRTAFVYGGLLSGLLPKDSPAAPIFGLFRDSDVYTIPALRNVTNIKKDILDRKSTIKTADEYLLRTLPVQNSFFNEIQEEIDELSDIPSSNWDSATEKIKNLVVSIDKRRMQLAPVFNPDDDTMLQIRKGERGEQLIEQLRDSLIGLSEALRSYNTTDVFADQRKARLALSEVGELLVSSYPYEVPDEGKFAYLPRLLGRSKVTFTFKRRREILGNVTVVADGYIAPVTAGCFLDLCIRGFYDGLPVKFTKRRLGSGVDFDVANIPVLGSFREGFYDPLTAKLRKIPLETIRVDRTSGAPKLSYARGLASLSSSEAGVEAYSQSRPLISFEIPGLLGLFHPDNKENEGSSEFFALQSNSVFDEKKKSLLDGDYAAFGVIIDGFDVFEGLRSGDIIDSTYIDEWGQLNLVKRKSSFSEVVKGSGQEEEL